MTRGSRPPKTSPMRWSASSDSTLSCTAPSTLWPADPCSRASGWTTPWLRSWWTEFWRRMDNMRSCSSEQVRHARLSSSVASWSPVSDQQRALKHYGLNRRSFMVLLSERNNKDCTWIQYPVLGLSIGSLVHFNTYFITEIVQLTSENYIVLTFY